MIKRYEKPFINDLTTEYSAFADGSTCFVGRHLQLICGSGIFAAKPCITGIAYNFNECYGGRVNLPIS